MTSIQNKLWAVIALGVIAGILEGFFDGVKVFGYLRDIFFSTVPALVAVRLYEMKSKE